MVGRHLVVEASGTAQAELLGYAFFEQPEFGKGIAGIWLLWDAVSASADDSTISDGFFAEVILLMVFSSCDGVTVNEKSPMIRDVMGFDNCWSVDNLEAFLERPLAAVLQRKRDVQVHAAGQQYLLKER